MSVRKFSLIFHFSILLIGLQTYAQSDTVKVKRDQVLLISDSLFIPGKDTLLLLEDEVNYQILDNRYILSKGFYDSIYQIAQKTRVTRELYDLLITNQPQEDPFANTEPVRSESFFEGFEGKVISSIQYFPVELFGGSVNDTTLKAQSSLGKLTNDLHTATQKRVVFNHLLFEVGDAVNPFKLADTERIIRSLQYIEDVRIVLKIDPKHLESVIAYVIVKDRFPWSADFTSDENGAYRAGFTNQNILGTGNEFGIGYFHARDEIPKNGYDARYTIRNVNNTFIDGTVFVSDNYQGTSKGILFRRDFLSPNIKYYGEIRFEHVEPITDLIFADSIYEKDFRVDRKSYDIWGGRSFLLGNRKTINTAIRLQHDNFDLRPQVRPDSNSIYQNHHFFVGSISYNKINFLKTKNVLSYNITEDVPIGFNYTILLGRDWTEFGAKKYVGFQSSYSTYNNRIGYVLLNLESGYFTEGQTRTDDVLQMDIRHFTPLIEIGNAYSRIFTRFNYFDGDNLTIPISETLEAENRLSTITGNRINGNKLTSLTFEYVVFQPWYYYGFRFATYGNLGVGYVQETRLENPYSETYYSMGGGIRIRNESLVFNTFDFGISLYPNAPTEGRVFYFRLNLSTPQFFQGPDLRKPKIVGLN